MSEETLETKQTGKPRINGQIPRNTQPTKTAS